eukprot:6175935-Pleurochrysis_carterae.AAC.4
MNTRKTDEVIAGVDGKPQRGLLVGDMPVDAVDARGNIQRLTLRNVRCVPSFRRRFTAVGQPTLGIHIQGVSIW